MSIHWSCKLEIQDRQAARHIVPGQTCFTDLALPWPAMNRQSLCLHLLHRVCTIVGSDSPMKLCMFYWANPALFTKHKSQAHNMAASCHFSSYRNGSPRHSSRIWMNPCLKLWSPLGCWSLFRKGSRRRRRAGEWGEKISPHTVLAQSCIKFMNPWMKSLAKIESLHVFRQELGCSIKAKEMVLGIKEA